MKDEHSQSPHTKKKKKKANKSNVMTETKRLQCIPPNNESVPDKEVEEFKKKLKENSVSAKIIVKIKPTISQEWNTLIKQELKI